MNSVRHGGIDAATMLNGRQKYGIAHIQQHAQKYLPLPGCTLSAMRRMVELPSIGVVKAGFVLQMLGYAVGCLDRHHLQLAGLDSRIYSRIPTSADALTLRLQTYIATCERLGGAAYLWNSWCSLIAMKYPGHFVSAEAVSAYHVRCVTLRNLTE